MGAHFSAARILPAGCWAASMPCSAASSSATGHHIGQLAQPPRVVAEAIARRGGQPVDGDVVLGPGVVSVALDVAPYPARELAAADGHHFVASVAAVVAGDEVLGGWYSYKTRTQPPLRTGHAYPASE